MVIKKHRFHKDGSRKNYYGKLCSCHNKEKYNMPVVDFSKFNRYHKKKYGETAEMDRSACMVCGWDKTLCDRHRIKLGCDGGQYTLGNVLVVCPNCHRLIHRGLLKLK